jgi:hypothetical protein
MGVAAEPRYGFPSGGLSGGFSLTIERITVHGKPHGLLGVAT